MKKFLCLVALAMMSVAPVFAQNNMPDRELSARYKGEITVLNNEIKTVKSQLKLDKGNSTLIQQLAEKKARMADLKDKKKTIDTAIKTKSKLEKAQKAAEKAAEKAEKAEAKAKAIRK